MGKKGFMMLIVLLTGIFIFLIAYSVSLWKVNDLQTFEVKTVQLPQGFGYHIYKGEALLVKQEFIPGVAGNLPFKNEIEAQIIGDLVVSKLVEGNLPTVNHSDLIGLKITLK